jgi:membrane fusion protein (multidrug efflux system)
MKLLSAAVGGVLVAGAVFAIASTTFQPEGSVPVRGSTSTDNAYVHADITPLSPRISGYIVEVGIRDHQAVRRGDVLFRIEGSDYVARRDQALAAVATRKAMLGTLAGQIARQHAVIQQADASLEAARAEAHRAELDLTRIRNLKQRGAESQESEEHAEADHLQGRARVAEAKANLEAAQRQLDVLESQRPQLQADIDTAGAALRLAEIDLQDTVVRAPSNGWVGERHARVGQYVRPGTLLVAVVGEEAWIVANFKETQIPRMQIGEPVSISVDGVPHRKFRGHIESLSPASGARFALLPPDNATGNFTRVVQRIPVKIVFNPGQQNLRDLRPGMSAEVTTTPDG